MYDILVWMYIVSVPVYVCYMIYALSTILQAIPGIHRRHPPPFVRRASFEMVLIAPTSSDHRWDVCPICMDALEMEGTVAIQLRQCRHQFHLKCLTSWNHGYQQNCPLCRQYIGHIV